MKRLVIATKNKGKVAELREPLAAFGFEVSLPPENFPDIEENGTSFEENALIKARAVSAALGCAALADDSGLCVEALDGGPGIFSARYGADWPPLHEKSGGGQGEPESQDARNNRKLLAALKDVPPEKRAAAFHCAMALVFPDRTPPLLARGIWPGRILETAAGRNGFGYDPLFFDPEKGCSAAEMDRAEKMRRSHRARALTALLEELRHVR